VNLAAQDDLSTRKKVANNWHPARSDVPGKPSSRSTSKEEMKNAGGNWRDPYQLGHIFLGVRCSTCAGQWHFAMSVNVSEANIAVARADAR
jgi:hypothetical protein